MTITAELIGAAAALITAIAGTGILTYRLTVRKLRAETKRLEVQSEIERDALNDSIINRVRGVMELERAHFEREIVDLHADAQTVRDRLGAYVRRVESMEQERIKDRSRIDHLESSMIIALDYISQLRNQLIINQISPPPMPVDLLDWKRYTGTGD